MWKVEYDIPNRRNTGRLSCINIYTYLEDEQCTKIFTFSYRLISRTLKLLLIINRRIGKKIDGQLNGTQFSFVANKETGDDVALFKIIIQRWTLEVNPAYLRMFHRLRKDIWYIVNREKNLGYYVISDLIEEVNVKFVFDCKQLAKVYIYWQIMNLREQVENAW